MQQDATLKGLILELENATTIGRALLSAMLL
jgi:hypothetical protein